MCSSGPTRSLGKATPCRIQRGVNDNGDPYSSGEENQSAVQVVFPSEDCVKPVPTPKRSDRVNQEVDGGRGRCDGECECCVEPCDVRLEDGHRTRDEKGIDGRDLVIERVFHPSWGVEYEDSW